MKCNGVDTIDLNEILTDIVVPDLDTGSVIHISSRASQKDIFAEEKRKAWDKSVEARCDFTYRLRLTRRSNVNFISIWQKSVYGRTLTEIKADDDMVQFFAESIVPVIREMLGYNLAKGDWAVVTTPKRRHLTKNFATRISEVIAQQLGIPFYEDVAFCHSKHRMNAVFTLNVLQARVTSSYSTISLPQGKHLPQCEDFSNSTAKTLCSLPELTTNFNTMATDIKFTELIQQWLETPTDERDYAIGALYLLKLSGNQIMYRNLMANPKKKAEFIEYQIRKYYNFRVQALTHAQVEEMQKQVDVIAQVERLDTQLSDADTNNPAKEFKKGKRDDHDTLPDDIQALYVENLSIVQRMREVHLKLRSLSTENSTCPDSERYPFLKELIELDKRLHANWETYDHFVGSQSEFPKETATKKVAKKKATKKK